MHCCFYDALNRTIYTCTHTYTQTPMCVQQMSVDDAYYQLYKYIQKRCDRYISTSSPLFISFQPTPMCDQAFHISKIWKTIVCEAYTHSNQSQSVSRAYTQTITITIYYFYLYFLVFYFRLRCSYIWSFITQFWYVL